MIDETRKRTVGDEELTGERTAEPLDPLSRFARWMSGGGKSGEVDSVTGATITFVAVADALYEGSEYVKKLKPGEEPTGENAYKPTVPSSGDSLPIETQPSPTEYIQQVETQPVPAEDTQTESGGTE
jgi:hypothetical protein